MLIIIAYCSWAVTRYSILLFVFNTVCYGYLRQIFVDFVGFLRRVHTMKVMRIGSELIHIVCVHTECTLTAIRIECAFSQSTFIGGLKLV